jgi:hypothetical protein
MGHPFFAASGTMMENSRIKALEAAEPPRVS